VQQTVTRYGELIKQNAAQSKNIHDQGKGFYLHMRNALNELKEEATKINDIHVMNLNLFDHSIFINYAKRFVYDQLKKRSEAGIALIRDPIMFEGFLRHVILFNFVESFGNDRRTVTPPPAYQ
jgi:hypothetical protein